MNKEMVLQTLSEMPETFEFSDLIDRLVVVRDEADRIEYDRLAETFSPEEKQRRAEFVALITQRIESAKTEKTYTMDEARAYLDGREAQRQATAEKSTAGAR